MHNLIKKVIEDKIGKKVIEITEYSHARVNKVYCIKTKNLEVVMKIAPKRHDKYPNKFDIEKYAFLLCRKRGLPTPKVILIDNSRGIFDTPYTISKKLPGDIINYDSLNQEQINVALKNMGHSLSIIHSIKTRGFGPFNLNGVGTWSNWSQILEDKLESLEKIYRYNIITSKLKEGLNLAIDKNSELSDHPNPCLIHGDYNLTNLLIDNSQNITGIVDMEHCYSGDPIYDLALFDYYYSKQGFLKILMSGYSNIDLEKEKKKILFYKAIISISKLAWKYETKQFLNTIKPSVSLLEKQINQLIYGY
ncbi:MAG: aminoglycoside phosphotransferase family protein [Nanoarchaeota archaeon]|nr:aminoglycoside phosphotransferase family protein [Nanoarchaeota archaeon]